MRIAATVVCCIAVAGVHARAGGQPAKTEKVETVAVGGCLKEAGGVWVVASASDPVPSTAVAPLPKELASLPKSGTQSYQLIGTGIFDLAAHRDHSVVVKGLLIKATPQSRLNMTSLTMVAATCPPPPASPD